MIRNLHKTKGSCMKQPVSLSGVGFLGLTLILMVVLRGLLILPTLAGH